MLELHARKPARAVLRGGGSGDRASLPDQLDGAGSTAVRGLKSLQPAPLLNSLVRPLEALCHEVSGMSDKQARAVGGSCLGGVLGGVLGVIVGGFLGPVLMGAGQQKTNTFLDLQDTCVGFLGLLIGASLGGVIGAVGGSVFGAGVATRSRADESAAPPDTPIPGTPNSPQLAQESTETELARLKERMAELEARKRREEQP
jgi:hypothetical protein